MPFLGDPIPPLVAKAFSTAAKGGEPAISWAPASVSADPDNHLVYATDSLPGKITAIKLIHKGLKIIWKANQTILIRDNCKRFLNEKDSKRKSWEKFLILISFSLIILPMSFLCSKKCAYFIA